MIYREKKRKEENLNAQNFSIDINFAIRLHSLVI